MSKFYICEEKFLNDAKRIENVQRAIKDANNKVLNIKNGLGALSLPGIAGVLEAISMKLIKEASNTGLLHSTGITISELYKKTEETISGNTVWNKLKNFLDDLILTKEERQDIQNQIDQLTGPYTYEDDYGTQRVDVFKMSEEERQELIDLYEKLHPDYAKDMDKCLKPLKDEGYDDDIMNIKAIAYTAPEPYRSMYLENVGDVNIADLHYDKTKAQNYNSGIDVDNDGKADGGIRFNIDDKWDSDLSKRYTTFFHESGHAIDDIIADGKPGGDYYTQSYKDDYGDHLTDTLQSDVRSAIGDYVNDYLKDSDLNPIEQMVVRNRITNEIMGCFDEKYDYPVMDDCKIFGKEILSADDMQDLLDSTVTAVKNDNIGPSSDVMGGYTGNLLRNGNGHSAIRVNDDGSLSNYWVNGSDESGTFVPNEDDFYSGQQEKEFWAEKFAAEMTGNKDELDGIDGRLDNGTEFMENMIADI